MKTKKYIHHQNFCHRSSKIDEKNEKAGAIREKIIEANNKQRKKYGEKRERMSKKEKEKLFKPFFFYCFNSLESFFLNTIELLYILYSCVCVCERELLKWKNEENITNNQL